MYELMKTSLCAYASLAAFMGWFVLSFIYGTFKKTRTIESKKIRTALRIGVSTALTCFWLWFDVFVNLYPISLAYYEYNNNLVEEKIGILDNMEIDGKDRMRLILDGTEYTVVYSSIEPYVVVGKDIKEGDTVEIKFGERSKYIFEIRESDAGS